MIAELESFPSRFAEVAEVEFYEGEDCVCLAHLRVRETAPPGTGKAILAALFQITDRLNLPVILFAVPERRKSFRTPMSQTVLIEWYCRNGFVQRRGMFKSCLIHHP